MYVPVFTLLSLIVGWHGVCVCVRVFVCVCVRVFVCVCGWVYVWVCGESKKMHQGKSYQDFLRGEVVFR